MAYSVLRQLNTSYSEPRSGGSRVGGVQLWELSVRHGCSCLLQLPSWVMCRWLSRRLRAAGTSLFRPFIGVCAPVTCLLLCVGATPRAASGVETTNDTLHPRRRLHETKEVAVAYSERQQLNTLFSEPGWDSPLCWGAYLPLYPGLTRVLIRGSQPWAS